MLAEIVILLVCFFHVMLIDSEIFGCKGMGRSIFSPLNLCLSYQKKSVSSFANDHSQTNLSFEVAECCESCPLLQSFVSSMADFLFLFFFNIGVSYYGCMGKTENVSKL